MKTKKLNVNHIIKLHEMLIENTGGTAGLRDKNLLESAIESPFLSFSGIYFYPTVIEKAARLCYGIIKNHPFIDGNKRIGILSMLEFLKINGFILICSHENLINIGFYIADGTFDENDLDIFLKKNIEKLTR